ncbi:hypothetical protein [Enterococcus sp. AZ102]|uniref:hypothetical protein n=1 Tax=Enterococcus sp. AZ102 TaxID=2774865 RepID=UPI003F29AF25
MKTLIRKTIAGNEYWDSEAKRTLFVPKGKNPDFEVTENAVSIITPEGDSVTLMLQEEQQESSDEDQEVVEEVFDDQEPVGDEEKPDLENMTAKQLRDYAKKQGIDIPAAIRAKGDILQIIQESGK